MAKYLLILLIPLLASCTNTKYHKRQYCSVCLQTQDRILLDIQVPDLNQSQNDRIYNIVKKQFGKNQAYEFGSLEDWHYEITALNLQPGEDIRLYDELGIHYILIIGLAEHKGSLGLDILEPDKAKGLYPAPRQTVNSSSTVEMSLWDVLEGKQVFILDLLTQSTELGKSGSDGTAYYVDSGTVYGTIKAGARKGSKYLLADCACPKGSYVRWSRILQWL